MKFLLFFIVSTHLFASESNIFQTLEELNSGAINPKNLECSTCDLNQSVTSDLLHTIRKGITNKAQQKRFCSDHSQIEGVISAKDLGDLTLLSSTSLYLISCLTKISFDETLIDYAISRLDSKSENETWGARNILLKSDPISDNQKERIALAFLSVESQNNLKKNMGIMMLLTDKKISDERVIRALLPYLKHSDLFLSSITASTLESLVHHSDANSVNEIFTIYKHSLQKKHQNQKPIKMMLQSICLRKTYGWCGDL